MTRFSPQAIDLVESLLEARCDMWAVGTGYYIGEPGDGPEASVVRAILRDFGPRRHLTADISGYLRSIGRDIETDCTE